MYDLSGCRKAGKRIASEILSVLEEAEAPQENAVFLHLGGILRRLVQESHPPFGDLREFEIKKASVKATVDAVLSFNTKQDIVAACGGPARHVEFLLQDSVDDNLDWKSDVDPNHPLKRVCDYFTKRKNFGNGRFVDKVIQKTLMRHASSDTANIEIITGEDIPTIEELTQSTVKNTGDVENALNKKVDEIVEASSKKETPRPIFPFVELRTA